MIRVLIAGSRDFNDFELLDKAVKHYLKQYGLHRQDIEVVSGGARGTDKLGEQFANKYSIKLTIFPADWNTYGKSAGYIRNEQMIKYIGDTGIVFAFWDGQSHGTAHTIKLANKYNIKVHIIRT